MDWRAADAGQRLGYRARMQAAFGRDPLVCPRCGGAMWLWQIWHPQYGVIDDELERMKAGCMREWNDPFAAALSPTERALLGRDQTVTYRYRCSRCGHEDDVPDVVIMGFAASGGWKPGQLPRLVCPTCGGPFRALGRGRSRAAR